MSIRRGEIYYADLSPVVGSEQGGVRPVLIVQNDVGNKHSPTVIAAAITSQREKAKLPTHIEVIAEHCGLQRNSIVLLEQIRTIDKQRLREKMGMLDAASMHKIDTALSVSFGLVSRPSRRREQRIPPHPGVAAPVYENSGAAAPKATGMPAPPKAE